MSLHILYRFYGPTDQLLYVGITCNPPSRWKKHRARKEGWWSQIERIDLEHHPSRAELRDAELRAIEMERPIYNIADGGTYRPPLVYPEAVDELAQRIELTRRERQLADAEAADEAARLADEFDPDIYLERQTAALADLW